MDSIVKSNYKRNFTSVNNDFIRDQQLSWKAKGIIIYVMSLPDDWQLHISELFKHARDGRDSTYNGIRELIDRGYCRRSDVRDSRGMFAGYEYTISDRREFVPDAENPDTENPHTGNPDTEKPDVLNTNKPKTEINQGLTEEKADVGLFPSEPAQSISRPRRTSEPLCLFSDSRFSDYDVFAAEFKGDEFNNIDILYYFHAVADWSAQKGKKMRDWIATTRNFIRGDMEKGKVHFLNTGIKLSPDAVKYLQEMAD